MSVCRVAWIFAGSVLGAGLVSGQELWQFFGRFGIRGWAGLIVSMLLFMLLGGATLVTAHRADTPQVDKVILPFRSEFFSAVVCVLQLLFLVSLVTVMISGAGELANSITGQPKWIMCLITSVIAVVISFAGINGAAAVFSFCVPVIAFASVAFSVAAIFCFGKGGYTAEYANSGTIAEIAAAFTYASYNSFASLGVLCPFAVKVRDKKTLMRGAALGTLVLAVISASILAALYVYPHAPSQSMPMLALAFALNPISGYIYGALLFMGLLQTAVSGIAAFDALMCNKSVFYRKKRFLMLIFFGAAVFVLSLFDFSVLIKTVYSVFGYINAFFTVGILINLINMSRRCSQTE